MSDTLESLQRQLKRAQQDEIIDGQRADQAYARRNARRGRFYAQESRRDFLTQQIIQRRINRLTTGA
ncbi:hypothetical protein PBI_DEWDROP_8 [Microbacterium phage Dewdrop]|nr:hypothetical protein PBI_LEAF_8 [Microbacterium phage Leaf]QGZ17377.1 hypothetical protein PBI_DEWDROP_8 [Microbacterium phage Dewdrop]